MNRHLGLVSLLLILALFAGVNMYRLVTDTGPNAGITVFEDGSTSTGECLPGGACNQ